MDNDGQLMFHSDERRYEGDQNRKIMLTSIVCLCVVVVIVSLLHIYSRFVVRRQERRRATMQHLRLAVSQARTTTTITTEPSSTGLNPAIIASLPLFVFKHTGINDDTSAERKECAICLSFIKDKDVARLLPNCKHTFHAKCIDKWLTSHSTCPICRTEAEPYNLPQPCEIDIEAGGTLPTTLPVELGNSDLTITEGTSDGEVELQITQSPAKIVEDRIRS